MLQANKVSKCYRIYHRPSDRLKELFSPSRKQLHEPFWAVRDVDLDVPRGCCLGIIGENGSGKSTLLRMIAGVARPTSGSLNVEGRVSALLELGAGFNPQFTGRENIFLNASILGMKDSETRARIPAIERFADIGEFVDRPVRTYSSGMFVRLAFAVAVHVDPDILVVDEALSVGDLFFQQRCIRKIRQLKQEGVTIIFVSHDLDAVRSLADTVIWMEHGRAQMTGSSSDVVPKYMGAMLARGRRDAMSQDGPTSGLEISPELDMPGDALQKIPAFLESIPNIDQRFGNGKASIRGIGVFDAAGDPTISVGQGDRLCVRISVEFRERVANPNVGFMLRNKLGQDITATNLMFEGEQIPAVEPGDRLSVDFILDLPLLQGAFYHLSPAVAEGTLEQYEICDWIDNAFAIEVVERTVTYGHMRIPMRVRTTTFPHEALKSS